jgi:hypothetical protein
MVVSLFTPYALVAKKVWLALPPVMSRPSDCLNWSPSTGEVVEKGEIALHDVGVDARCGLGGGLVPAGRERITVREAAVGGIERAKAADEALVDGALRDLVGRVPRARVGHPRDGEAIEVAALGVAQHAVELAQVVGALPGPIEPHNLARGE